MSFTDAELAYLDEQPLGRLATIGPDGAPHVMPVGCFVDQDTKTIVIGGIDLAASKKYRDARRNPEVALVVDDLASVDPWRPRGIEIRGIATTHDEGGEEVGERLGAGFPFDPAWMAITPRRILAWGLDGDGITLSARDVGYQHV